MGSKTKERRSVFKGALSVITVLLILYLQHCQLSYSASVAIRKLLFMAPQWQLINCMISAVPFLLFLLLTSRVKLSLLLSSILVTVLSVANNFTLLFHGSPFLASDFYSIPTAMNVLSEYHFNLGPLTWRILFLALAEIVLIVILYVFRGPKRKIKWFVSMAAMAVNAALIYFLFFSPWTVFPHSLFTWSWGPAVNEYGYELCLLNSCSLLRNRYQIPEGYSAEIIEFTECDPFSDGSYPDVVIILNETLCDLSFYAPVPEGREVIDDLFKIPTISSGYSTASLVGGGTNNTEYELLTSNSMAGLTITAPFQLLNMNGADSVVSYLKWMGYNTAAMHCGNATNYGRNNAYPAMGFDQLYLGLDSFDYFREYGNRNWLDEDNYLDMLEAYEAMGDGPRLMYLLTFQNHGGYEQNEPEWDTVSIQEDFGEYTDDVNEYLTSVQMSALAFKQLTEYFADSARPVIILMVGDHAPSFIQYLPAKPGITGLEKEIALRTVPYFVWANFEIDNSALAARSSMVDLVPMMLKAADFPLTSYYKTILDLNKNVPVRTMDGAAMDAEGNYFRIGEDTKYSSILQQYYYMEYNALRRADDYRPELFSLAH